MAVRAVEDPLEVMLAAYGSERRTNEAETRSLRNLGEIALGWMGRQEAVDILKPLLQDSDGSVRVAAAMSILRLLQHYRPIADVPAVGEAEPRAPTPKVAAPGLYTADGKD